MRTKAMSKTIEEIATCGIRCYVAGVLNKGWNEDGLPAGLVPVEVNVGRNVQP